MSEICEYVGGAGPTDTHAHGMKPFTTPAQPTSKRQAQIDRGECWCGKSARKGWTTCTKHYTSGRKN